MIQKKSNKKEITNSHSKKLIYIDDSPIFKFLNPNGNDKLTKMHKLDLQNLIILIDDYYIQLREQLGFEQYVTFGLELEFEDAMRERIVSKLNIAFPNGDWIIKDEPSLRDGYEINSPILRDTNKNWENLNKVCNIVERFATIGERSGGHIHAGTQTLGKKTNSWLNFIKLWSVYENVIFRFAYGSYLTARSNIKSYAAPCAKEFWNDYMLLKNSNVSLVDIITRIQHKRHQAVNFSKVYIPSCHKFEPNNTIEFRCPNGTSDAAIWQNNTNLFIKILEYSKSSLFNDDIIEKRHNLVFDKYNELKWYNEIYLDQALELCDLLFNNNFDKIYFLRQYLKSFEVIKENTNYQKANTLVKKGIKKTY